ncbi:MAG: patatin-like phospholipase family protein [Hyphomicrobiaceae bacterium]|nr:patatin-like phospholipase family protein [Hyphomicrobiaceae bacterium]
MTHPPTVLDSVEMFAHLDPEDRARLVAELETLTFRRGEVLVRQGDVADALYVVLTGRFSVTIAGRAEPIAELGPGQPVGEIAFVAGGTRTASVTALRDSLVVRLRRREFDALSERHPGIWRMLTLALAQRLAEANQERTPRPDPRPRTIALVRAGSSTVPDWFIQALAEAFRSNGRVAVMGPAKAPGIAPPPADLDSSGSTRILNALEHDNDFVLFVADDEPTPWSDTVIRQADLVLAVGQHHANATPNALERRVAELLQPEARRLVLLHARRDKISDTARWLRGRAVAMHHHVARTEPDDVARVVRFIGGTAVGLVACGGGAYCAAHIGVYKALLEAGVTFDIMGGTSGGGAMTAAFAMGSAPDEVDTATHDIFVTNAAMRRYTVPRYSLLDHRHFDAQLAKHYGGQAIEDLWIPFFCVSTDLSRYDLHRHRTGSVWEAVRATSSIPVLLPPFYTEDGHMLVDGALLDNVPVRVMHELKSGPNVVVSFATPSLERFEVAYDALPDRPTLIKSLINPFSRAALPPAPGVASVLMRSLMANRHDFERQLRPDDLLVVPPIPPDMGLLHWHRHGELKDLAHAWMRAEVARLAAEGHTLLGRMRR